MIIHAVLGNPNHPEYGVATIPFPIPHDQYAHCMELLEALEIGDAVKADCQVQEINSFYSVLKHTEKLTVNVEELNYLAKRLDGFDMGAFLQATILIAGLLVFKEHALLGIGLMLSSSEITRIAGAFGLDTSTRANIMSAVYTAQTAVHTGKAIVQAVSK